MVDEMIKLIIACIAIAAGRRIWLNLVSLSPFASFACLALSPPFVSFSFAYFFQLKINKEALFPSFPYTSISATLKRFRSFFHLRDE